MNRLKTITSPRNLLTEVGGGILLNTLSSDRKPSSLRSKIQSLRTTPFVALLLALVTTILVSACGKDEPDVFLPHGTADTRAAADSSAAGGASATLEVDTAWAGEYHYDFDGNAISPDDHQITIPDEPAEGDAADAV